MIKVMVELVAHLKDDKFTRKEVNLPLESTVRDLFKLLHFENEKDFVVILNGKHANFESALRDGDNLIFMPFVDGG